MRTFIRYVRLLCDGFAMAGGILLLAIALMTMASVIGRNAFDTPIHGDFDMTKSGLGIVLAAFIPYCIVNGGLIIVDFFTAKSKASTKQRMDIFGTLCMVIGLGLFAWRSVVGTEDMMESNEVAGNTNILVWWVYAAMAPSFVLATFAAIARAMELWMGDHHETEAEAILKQAARDDAAAQVATRDNQQGAAA